MGTTEADLGPDGRCDRGARRGRLDRRGASAIEFALVGPIFFLMLFAIS